MVKKPEQSKMEVDERDKTIGAVKIAIGLVLSVVTAGIIVFPGHMESEPLLVVSLAILILGIYAIRDGSKEFRAGESQIGAEENR